MREFFEGRRRKAGVVTLVVAIVLATFWLSDVITSTAHGIVFYRGAYPLPDRTSENIFDRVVVKEGALFWETFRAHGPLQVYDDQIAQWDKSLLNRTRSNCVLVSIDDRSDEWRWKWNSCGFDFGEFSQNHPDGFTMVRWGVPFWSVVWPLSLLSAWMLLSKPRPLAPKTTEPAPTTRA